MSHDERAAARIRAVLAPRRDVVERKMFGGLTFMVNGAMCCGITAKALVHAISAAAGLPSKAAVSRLVQVTLTRVRPEHPPRARGARKRRHRRPAW